MMMIDGPSAHDDARPSAHDDDGAPAHDDARSSAHDDARSSAMKHRHNEKDVRTQIRRPEVRGGVFSMTSYLVACCQATIALTADRRACSSRHVAHQFRRTPCLRLRRQRNPQRHEQIARRLHRRRPEGLCRATVARGRSIRVPPTPRNLNCARSSVGDRTFAPKRCLVERNRQIRASGRVPPL